MKDIKPINPDKLPRDFNHFIENTGISGAVKSKGQIFKTMARLKLEYKFSHSLRKKMNEVVGVYQENEAQRVKRKSMNISNNEESEEEQMSSAGPDATREIEDLFGQKSTVKK